MKKLFIILSAVTLFACATDVEITLPRGPEGKSAYEVWKEAVEQGILYHWGTGEIWPADRTTLGDFYYFLTGQNGEDGRNGLSAYEQWKGSLPSGIDNPRKDLYSSSFWPMDKNTVEDFWDYLSGVTGAKGDKGDKGDDGSDADVLTFNIPSRLYETNRTGAGTVITVKSDRNWTFKPVKVMVFSNIKVDEYLTITPTKGQTYTYNGGTIFEPYDGSIAWTVKKLPAAGFIDFECNFEISNLKGGWINETFIIRLKAVN